MKESLMNTMDVAFSAFEDELNKISSAASAAVEAGGEAVAKKVPSWVRPTGLMVAGAGTYHVARQANEDRALGKQYRMQQQG